tara:strand:- start:190 stop:642 length:453 start_codon:yes stop_codon:yes gene_type:complete
MQLLSTTNEIINIICLFLAGFNELLTAHNDKVALKKLWPFFCTDNRTFEFTLMKVTLIKTRKPKKFSFKARYYDADKEDFEARKQTSIREYKLEQKTGMKADDIRARFQQEWGSRRSQTAESRRSTITIALIASVLFLALYIYLFTDILV